MKEEDLMTELFRELAVIYDKYRVDLNLVKKPTDVYNNIKTKINEIKKMVNSHKTFFYEGGPNYTNADIIKMHDDLTGIVKGLETIVKDNDE
ncbi:MAG: hypothetical protein OXH57_04690 [Ekhidna sp.]|nr:hypothetical protein [Ekhidna sp.]